MADSLEAGGGRRKDGDPADLKPNGPLQNLFDSIRSSPNGLSSEEALRRLSEFGLNRPEATRTTSPVREFLRFGANPLVMILLVAALISAFVGEVVDAVIIAAIVLLSMIVNFVQASRSERAVNRLRDTVATTATARRDGAWAEIPRSEVVPGDIVRLAAGDLIPGDARILESRDLHVQQAALTGESMPTDKRGDDDCSGVAPLDSPNLLFLGTSVVSGTATAMVFATGHATCFGDIARRLAERAPETEFDRGLREFGALITKTVFFLMLFILAVNLGFHRNALESLLFAVALAVGLTPEFLPMITTVTLAAGAVRMARKKVIVKRLAAIQNLGSVDILCTDKTGTLTAGKMTLDSWIDPFAEPSERTLHLAYLNSRFQTGIKSPLDQAILEHPPASDATAYQKTDEIPFDFERRRLSVVVSANGHNLLISKGAPESVLAVSSEYEANGARHRLDESARQRCEETYRRLGERGLRVIAVAYRADLPQPAATVADERNLTLAGFLAFVDPPLAGAAEAIAALRRDGVHIKLLSGDNELVTRDVCRQMGINAFRIVLGTEIERLGDNALAHVAETVHVFARVSPAQKSRIIRALKQRSHVVAFIGDGINDAPSLHVADVGISVASAVDVARDAADIVLLESHLHVLHSGIIEGRRAFGNVIKYILMGTSSNFGNMFSMAGAALLLPFLPMLPTQILLNNFLYDLAQLTIPTDHVDPAYINRPQRWNMGIIRNFMVVIGPLSSIFDFLTFFVLLRLFHSSEVLFHTGWFVESLATQTLVVFIIRTARSPWTNLPSRPLMATTILAVLVGTFLPFSPLAAPLGLVPLPPAFLAFLVLATVVYLALVELVKRRLMGRLIHERPQARSVHRSAVS